MIVKRLITLAVLAFVVAEFSFPFQASSTEATREDYFEVTLPEGFEISKQSPVEDFQLFRISRRNQLFVTIYIGNWPMFPALKASNGVTATTFRSPNCEMNSLWGPDGLRGREILIKSSRTSDRPSPWPTRLHAVTANLDPHDVRIADQILSSIISKL
jgi:hypothetical protein